MYPNLEHQLLQEQHKLDLRVASLYPNIQSLLFDAVLILFFAHLNPSRPKNHLVLFGFVIIVTNIRIDDWV